MKECLFCTKKDEKTSITWENKNFYSVFDNYPVSPGHSLVIPKRHIVELENLHDEEWKDLKNSIKDIKNTIESTNLITVYTRIKKQAIDEQSVWFSKQAINHPKINQKPEGYNHGVNDGTAAGRTVDHMHWHIIPRFTGDMEDPRGGVRYVIPSMGNYKNPRI